MNAKELLQTYLSSIQNPGAAAALFADDGIIELPTVNARAQVRGHSALPDRPSGESAGLPVRERPDLDRDARPGLR